MLKTNKLSQSVNLAVSPFLVCMPEEFMAQPVKKAEGAVGIVRVAPVAKNKPYIHVIVTKDALYCGLRTPSTRPL